MAFHKLFLYLFFSVFLVLGSWGCEFDNDKPEIVLEDVAQGEELLHDHEGDKENSFHFGFDLRSNPQEDARQYLPFLQYLKKKTGLNFELRFTPKSRNISDDLGGGVVHFAAVGAGSYLVSHQKYGVVMLARGLNSMGKAEYRSCLVVSPKSSIQSLEDLQGKSIVFGNKSSTQGYLIPRIILMENNLPLEGFAEYRFTGSHRTCAEEVIAGRADVCGMQDTMAQDLSDQGLLRILHTSSYYPSSGIAVNKSVGKDVIAKVKKALLDFQPNKSDRKGLYNWDKTEMPNGFIESKDTDYDELLYWADKLGYLTSEDN